MKTNVCAADWSVKQKRPFTKSKVRKYTLMRLEEMRNAGIKFVSLLGCNYAPDECDSLRAMKGQKIAIETAPLLPLPGCDKKHCKCIWLAKMDD